MTVFTRLNCSVTIIVSVMSLIAIDYLLMFAVVIVTLMPLLNPLFWGRSMTVLYMENGEVRLAGSYEKLSKEKSS